MAENKNQENKGASERKDAAEDKRKKDLKAIIEGKMDEYGMTKKTVYSVLGILGCLALTIVMSITGIGFNPDVFLTWNYWVAMIIQFAIAIFAMITGRQIGDDTKRNKPDGQFRRELTNYSRQYKKIEGGGIFEFFEDWLDWYRERKIRRKIIVTLHDFGIKQKEVLDLDYSDLDNLLHPFVKDWTGTPYEEKYYNKEKNESKTTFLSLTETQVEALKKIMEGYVTVPDVSASYFMDALKGTSVDEWDRAAKSGKKKGAKLANGYTYRIFIILVSSLVTNGLISVPYENASDVALNIAMRIFILVTSMIWGIYLGMKIVDMDTVFLTYKTYVLKKYCDEYESGKFKPESIEQKAAKEYNKYQEEERKARESVMTPELIDDDDVGVPLLEAKN